MTWFGWGHNFRAFVKPLLPVLRSLDFVDFAWAGADVPDAADAHDLSPR